MLEYILSYSEQKYIANTNTGWSSLFLIRHNYINKNNVYKDVQLRNYVILIEM